MIYFESERLIFSDWEEDDLPAFSQMNEDPEVMEYFLNPLAAKKRSLGKGLRHRRGEALPKLRV